jgi:hypothetical protein
MASTRVNRKFDLSGGVQTATSRLLAKPNELQDARNALFSTLIGAVSRRLGYSSYRTVQTGKDGLGAFVHRYSTGTRLYAATNNSGDTATIIKYDNAGTMTDLGVSGIAVNTRISALNFLDEAYVVGSVGTTFMSPINIDSSPAFSTTRNILNMPKAKWLAEFQGSLYAINVDVGGTKYSDRAYKSSPAEGIITFVKTDQTSGTTLKVDSVRYLKAAMNIDIYRAGTSTKLYDIAISSVDKSLNTITFTATALNFATTDVNTGTDVITLSSTASFPTGTPVVITSTTTVPAGLTSGTVYYVINVSGTTIKLATTAALASAGTAIDITSQGTGTHTITFQYVVTDNDEIWGDGRKDKLSVYWNTDYPTPESSDYLRIPPGQDEDPTITGWAKTTNRLFLFTNNSLTKWDGANLVTVSNTIGCLQHECIQQIGAWLIWPHYTGIWAYNDSTGQLKLISRGIKDWFKAVPLANWASASSVALDNIYKLSVGSGLTLNNISIQGSIRFVYDFDMNIWSIESHTRNQRFQFVSTASNVRNPYFQDDTGLIIKDEDGNLDISATIPWFVETGRENFGIDELKNYGSVYIYANKARSCLVKFQLDGGEWLTLGELTEPVQKFDFPLNSEGHDINYRLSLNSVGESPIVEGISTHYSVLEGFYAK